MIFSKTTDWVELITALLNLASVVLSLLSQRPKHRR